MQVIIKSDWHLFTADLSAAELEVFNRVLAKTHKIANQYDYDGPIFLDGPDPAKAPPDMDISTTRRPIRPHAEFVAREEARAAADGATRIAKELADNTPLAPPDDAQAVEDLRRAHEG